jgi:hypothetical protein
MAAIHVAIMCLTRRLVGARMLLHQETAACGSSALAHCNGSPMYTLTRYRSTRDRAVTAHHVTVIDRGLAIVVMAKGTEAMTMALMREIG